MILLALLSTLFYAGVQHGQSAAGPQLAQRSFNYHDRNPVTRLLTYTVDAVAQHGSTARINYTVPTGKKAYVSVASMEAVESAGVATDGVARIRLRVDTLTDAADNAARVTLPVGAEGQREALAVGGPLLLVAGEGIGAETENANTVAGASVDLHIALVIVEFDA